MQNILECEVKKCTEYRVPSTEKIRYSALGARCSGPNTTRFLIILLFLVGSLLFSNLIYADTSDTLKALAEPIVNVARTAKPIFSADEIKEPGRPADPFFEKIREKREDFLKKQQKRRKEFFRKIRREEFTSEERKRRVARFRQKESQRLEEFLVKQKRKIDKHHREG